MVIRGQESQQLFDAMKLRRAARIDVFHASFELAADQILGGPKLDDEISLHDARISVNAGRVVKELLESG